MSKTCCVTGHRQLPAEQLALIESELRRLIRQAIADGYDTFISGMAGGADQIFARLIVEAKAEYPVRLEAAIPYAARTKSRDLVFQSLLAQCDDVTVVCEQYSSGCFFARNRYLVDRSDAVIAVYDGRKSGGSYYTIQYAESRGREISFVRVMP